MMPGEHLLVIDDSPTVLKVIETTLTKAGYFVDTAPGGVEGLSQARDTRGTTPALILLDCGIPNLDGVAFCRQLAEDRRTARVPSESPAPLPAFTPAAQIIHRTNRTELLFVEASAHLAKSDLPGAQSAVQAVLEKYPDDEDILATATHVYMTYGRYSNALATIDHQLKLTPDNAGNLVNKGYALIQLNRFDEAIPPLTKALSLETNNYTALLNRAISYFRGEKFEEAQRDYEALQKLFPTAFQVYYGLAEISYRKKDTNAAIRNYQLYLTNSPPNNEEAKFVIARLQELTPHSQ